VRLGHSGLFTTGRAEMWRNAAVFDAKAGGKCRLSLHEFAEGRGRLILFFPDEHSSAETRFHFEEFVLAHSALRLNADGRLQISNRCHWPSRRSGFTSGRRSRRWNRPPESPVAEAGAAWYGSAVTTTVNEGNAVSIPPEIAREFDIHPGTRLEWAKAAEGVIAIKPVRSRGELARQLMGAGRRWLKPGADPIGELVREREQDDQLDQADEAR